MTFLKNTEICGVFVKKNHQFYGLVYGNKGAFNVLLLGISRKSHAKIKNIERNILVESNLNILIVED